MKKRTKTFRVGQKVQSIYDSGHQFVIDRSMVPPRIFHERGSNRWWLKSELQRLGAPENPATSIRLNGKAKCAQNVPKCAQVVPDRLSLLKILSGAKAFGISDIQA